MHFVKAIPILLVVLVCVGCGSGNSAPDTPEIEKPTATEADRNPTPGTWEGTSSLGDISFEVDDSGENIRTMTYDFTCKTTGVTTTSSSTIEFVTPLEISGGNFDMEIIDIAWEGKFRGSDAASGTLTFMECDSSWEAAPQQ